MKKSSTLFLKFALIMLGLLALGFCLLLFFGFEGEGIRQVPYLMRFLDPFLILIFTTLVPFYSALVQAWKILTYVDKNMAFSLHSIQALKNIKYCAVIMSILYVSAMPIVFKFADQDDAPGIVLIWMVVIGVPIVIAVFSAVLEKLVKNALEIKSENDLTV